VAIKVLSVTLVFTLMQSLRTSILLLIVLRVFLFGGLEVGKIHAQSMVESEYLQFTSQMESWQSSANNPILFFEIPYRYPTIDLRDLQERTSFQLPESVKIVPPEVGRFNHPVVLVGISGEIEEPTLIVWIANDYHTNRFTLFVDQDQDRDFTNDRPPLRVKRGGQNLTIFLEVGEETQFIDFITPPVIAKGLAAK